MMRRLVYDRTGTRLIREEEAEPECGHDFCDRCGDCLACYAEDECWHSGEPGGEHMWVVTEE
ncbi:MAG: hypothetical protein FJZ90_03005 [Chloroflexi bacterium]|nr:hypothetical protein [Chloroflexota bacterium]